ncbi:MAG: DUF3298 domain-containing protein [Clostridia bacterium]
MKHKYIIALFCIFMFITVICINSSKEVQVKETFSSIQTKAFCNVLTIKENSDKYDIEVFYPETKYEQLNKIIKDKIDTYISDFKKEANENIVKSTLIIKFDSYEYKEYVSYLFRNVVDFGGAHPNTYSSSVNFDTKKLKEITIKDLIQKNKKFLLFLSEFAFDNLKNVKDMIKGNDFTMLKDGTLPKQENFQNFVFDKDGIKFFFDRYQVAPYYLGEFNVIVPYDKVNI